VGPRASLDSYRNLTPPLETDAWTVQPVVSHYTDYTILDMRAVDPLYYWLTLTISRNSNLTLFMTATFILYHNLLGRLSGVNK